jgi:pimeloyl-ACP methyl ester carboxylesterase
MMMKNVINRRAMLKGSAGLATVLASATAATKPAHSVESVTPFKIDIPQADIDDLRTRLKMTRWAESLSDPEWAYGTDQRVLKDLVSYWADGFAWHKQQATLNELPQFRTMVEGIGVHFIHVKGKGPNPKPLLLLHGWPSSIVQMQDIIPMLTDPVAYGGDANVSFDVVAPSLIGYGFSDQAKDAGMSVGKMAVHFFKLMTDVLGYGSFGIRASDLGAGVAQQLCLMEPNRVTGVHLSGTNPFIPQVPNDLSEAEKAFVQNAQSWMQYEMAYAFEQSSKPQTLAVGLNDSPAALASWIIEKFHRWTDRPEDFINRYGRDRLLANLSVYWFTGTIGSSIRLYAETARDQTAKWGRVEIPTAMLMTSKDMFPTPREWAARSYNVIRWTEIDRGGHFLEWEEPDLVAKDVQAFFASIK